MRPNSTIMYKPRVTPTKPPIAKDAPFNGALPNWDLTFLKDQS